MMLKILNTIYHISEVPSSENSISGFVLMLRFIVFSLEINLPRGVGFLLQHCYRRRAPLERIMSYLVSVFSA